MRYLTWVGAIAIAIIAVQFGMFASKTSARSESTAGISMNVMEMQMQADQNLPITVIDSFV